MEKVILSAFADEASANLDEQLEALKRAGIRRIEMRNVDGKSVKDLTEAEATQVRAKLDRAGVSLSAMGSPFGKIFINEPFEEHYCQFVHALKLCRILGTDRMRMFSFFIPEGEAPEKYEKEVFARLEKMLDAADEWGVRLLHENEKGIYGDTLGRCMNLITGFKGRLGCIFDPANFIQCGDKPIENFEEIGSYVEYMHIKDALLADGSVVPSGKGDGSLPEILDRIAKDEAGLTLSVEPHLTVFKGLENLQKEELHHKYSYPDSATAFQAAVDAIKEVLTGIGFKEEGVGTWTR